MENTREDVEQREISELIDLWYTDHVHNTPLARHEEVVNLLFAAKNDLKNRIFNLYNNRGDFTCS